MAEGTGRGIRISTAAWALIIAVGSPFVTTMLNQRVLNERVQAIQKEQADHEARIRAQEKATAEIRQDIAVLTLSVDAQTKSVDRLLARIETAHEEQLRDDRAPESAADRMERIRRNP